MKKQKYIGKVIVSLMLTILVSMFSNAIVHARSIKVTYVEFNVAQRSVTPLGISGSIQIWGYDEDSEEMVQEAVNVRLTSIIAEVNGKSYTGKIGKNNSFTIKYRCDYDTKVKLIAKDELGNTHKKTFKVKNIPFKLKVNDFYYTSQYITGVTTPKAKISVFIEDKEYKAKAAANGKFKVKVPKQKIGTSIFVGAVSPDEFNTYTEITTQQEQAVLNVNHTYNNDSQLKGYYTKAKKNDFTVVKYNGKEYTHKVKANKKVYRFAVKTARLTTGKKYTVTVYNNFHQKKMMVSDKVYSTHKIKVGMTRNTVDQSDWGKPDDITTLETAWGNFVTYFYYDCNGHSLICVSFKNNKVYAVNYTN